MQTALEHVHRAGYAVANVDSTLILQEPKIGPHSAHIQRRVAELLGIDAESVGVKAKTPEGMGTENAAIAHVIVLLTKQPGKRRRRAVAMEAVPQGVVDSVAETLLETVRPNRGKKK